MKSVSLIVFHDSKSPYQELSLVQIDQLNLPNLETEDLKIEFLNFDNGILAKFFFEKFENWNFNSEHSNLALRRWEPQDNAYLII